MARPSLAGGILSTSTPQPTTPHTMSSHAPAEHRSIPTGAGPQPPGDGPVVGSALAHSARSHTSGSVVFASQRTGTRRSTEPRVRRAGGDGRPPAAPAHPMPSPIRAAAPAHTASTRICEPGGRSNPTCLRQQLFCGRRKTRLDRTPVHKRWTAACAHRMKLHQ